MKCKHCKQYIGKDVLEDGVYEAMNGYFYCESCGKFADEQWDIATKARRQRGAFPQSNLKGRQMKKIRFIKENDLFDWKVGQIWITGDDGVIFRISVLEIENTGVTTTYKDLNIDELIKKGYAEWVKDPPSQPASWDKWIESKKKEFWNEFHLEYISDKKVLDGGLWSDEDDDYASRPIGWQLRLMYLWILEEYCREKDLKLILYPRGGLGLMGEIEAEKTAMKDMKPVLDKLKELSK